MRGITIIVLVVISILISPFAVRYCINSAHARLAPPPKPSLELMPSSIEPAQLGEVFAVNVDVSDLDQNWEVVGFNFSIAWNTTLIGIAAPYISAGTFLETFQYNPHTTLYLFDINEHNRPPPETPLPLDYNYSHVSVMLLPDPPFGGSYHPPYPSGGGTICTLYFQAIYSTIWLHEVYSQIDFIAEDVLILNTLNQTIGYSSLSGASYRAPTYELGYSIDLYGGANNSGHGPGYPGPFPPPFGGQGLNWSMDVVFPGSETTLYAMVMYNYDPVQQVDVIFKLDSPSSSINITATTDANGIAKIVYEMPWSSSNPENYTGLWNVTASIFVSGYLILDVMPFFYEYPVHFASVQTDKYFYNNSDLIQVTVTYSTHVFLRYSGTFMSTIENSVGTPISWFYAISDFGGAFGDWKNYTFMLTSIIPYGAAGYAYVHENCYDQDPSSGGVELAAEYEPPPEIFIEPGQLHDVAINTVSSPKTLVGTFSNISAEVGNNGQVTETFNVTAYANDTAISTQEISLNALNLTTLIFNWNSTGFVCGDYFITVYAWSVPEETYVTNNNATYSVLVHVGVPGDVSSSTSGVNDGTTNMKDIAYLVSLFNTKPSSPNWNPNADVNNDGVCNMKDIAIAVLHFNQHE